MKSVGLLVIIGAVTFGFTQPPDTTWTKTYGGAANEVGNSIKQTPDGGYIIAGSTGSFGAGQQDVWLLKTDENGDTAWTKTYGDIADDWAEEVQLTTDGGYILVANTEFGADRYYVWLIKTDSLGDTIWTKKYGTSRTQAGHSVRQTSDSGYIITGYESYPPVYGRLFLLKTDAYGDTVWSNRFFVGYSPLGRSVCDISGGGYVIAGEAWSAMPRIFCLLLKADANGDSVWSRSYGLVSTNSRLNCVMQTADSGYIACGFKGPKWRSKALWIVKTNFQGDSLWAREYGDSATERSGNSMQLTNDNGYIITGTCWEKGDNDLFLFTTNENGDSIWCATYGGVGADSGNEVQQTDDSGYIVVGCTESFGAGGSDVWLLKFEPEVAAEENKDIAIRPQDRWTTIFSGPLVLPEDKTYKVFDITGRVVEPTSITRGIYFIEIDDKIVRKVVKVR